MNALIIEQFNELLKQTQAEYLNAQVENNIKEIKQYPFKIKALKKILSIIKSLDFEITNADELKEIPGIGAGALRRIKEILENGYLSELSNKYNKIKQNKINGIKELEKVIGIGNRIARKLVVDYHIMNVDQLKKAIKKGKVKVNDKILIGLKYYGIVQTNIPREEIIITEKYLQKVVHKIDPKLKIIICGSYRRGKSVSGDIDVLLYNPDFKYTKEIKNPKMYGLKPDLELLIKYLETESFLLDHLTDNNPEMKYMGFCKYKNFPVRRIDIRFIPYNSLYTAILYFTGPYELNEYMRSRAKKRGMILNEYGLYKLDENGNKLLIPIKSEKEVFEKLGMEYLTPEERESYSTGKKTYGKV